MDVTEIGFVDGSGSGSCPLMMKLSVLRLRSLLVEAVTGVEVDCRS
jgi:hypothetical protein